MSERPQSTERPVSTERSKPRHKSKDHFYASQSEWVKQKELKIQKLRESLQDSQRSVSPITNLPADYKGPIKGYY